MYSCLKSCLLQRQRDFRYSYFTFGRVLQTSGLLLSHVQRRQPLTQATEWPVWSSHLFLRLFSPPVLTLPRSSFLLVTCLSSPVLHLTRTAACAEALWLDTEELEVQSLLLWNCLNITSVMIKGLPYSRRDEAWTFLTTSELLKCPSWGSFNRLCKVAHHLLSG